ncbi:MAG: DUF3108 domain-containing protein [Desulfobacteraceae bacterium]|nr:DUF3108 domain-containing protein [Desulfobacteraceae bacterium]
MYLRFHTIVKRCCIGIIGLFLISFTIFAEEMNFPFTPGEKLTYELRWQNIPAGEAVLEVMPVEAMQEIRSFHFVLTVKTTRFIDTFYKVRDRIDAWADVQMNQSVFFKQKQREGGYKKDATVAFDREKNEVRYVKRGKLSKRIDLLPGSFDPLSAFYFTRVQEMVMGQTIERPVSDGKKTVIGKVRVVARETITVKGKKFDTYLIEPDLKDVGGVFKKSKNAKIQLWLSADHKKIPIRIKSKVVVGSFVGELISEEGTVSGEGSAATQMPAVMANEQ